MNPNQKDRLYRTGLFGCPFAKAGQPLVSTPLAMIVPELAHVNPCATLVSRLGFLTYSEACIGRKALCVIAVAPSVPSPEITPSVATDSELGAKTIPIVDAIPADPSLSSPTKCDTTPPLPSSSGMRASPRQRPGSLSSFRLTKKMLSGRDLLVMPAWISNNHWAMRRERVSDPYGLIPLGRPKNDDLMDTILLGNVTDVIWETDGEMRQVGKTQIAVFNAMGERIGLNVVYWRAMGRPARLYGSKKDCPLFNSVNVADASFIVMPVTLD